MKTKMYFFMAAVLLFSFTGCSNDDDDDPNPPEPLVTGDATVQIKLSDATLVTYAASDEETPTNEESVLATKVEVFVFDENNLFEYHKQLGLNGSNVTDKFQISTGPKFFYVFSNMTGNIPTPGTNTTRTQFETIIREATISPSNTSISNDNQFFIGTLWADTVHVHGTGTPATPEQKEINVGRLVAKINLVSVKEDATGNLKGKFMEPTYRVRSIPSKFYLVGQHDGGLYNNPPQVGVQVKSAVHSIADTVSSNYTSYDFPASSNVNASFYTIENTSEPGADGNVYYGSTTHIQLRSKYEPHNDEIHNADGSQGGQIPASGTFYTGMVNGSLLIFHEDPSGLTGISDVKVYTDGLNYYNLPMRDLSESTISLQTSIIRNHYYELSVVGISKLGENTDYIDPSTPIVDNKDIELKLNVLPWSKVAQQIDI